MLQDEASLQITSFSQKMPKDGKVSFKTQISLSFFLFLLYSLSKKLIALSTTRALEKCLKQLLYVAGAFNKPLNL